MTWLTYGAGFASGVAWVIAARAWRAYTDQIPKERP